MQDINFRNESSNLINFILPKADTITIDKLNEIYDNFFLEKSSTSSTNYLLNVLQLLENVDKTILMKPFMLNNEFNSYLIDKLYHLLKKFYKINYLNDQEYLLYHYLIKYFFRLEFNPQKFLRPIEKLLNIYSKDQTFFSNENYVKDFSKILSLFIQNQTIMTSIIKCLTNRYYIQSLENISHDYFILISCPSYWILYTGPNREEFSNRLLHSLLIPSCRIFAENSWKNSSKSLNLLIDVLNYSFVKCNVHLLINDDLLFLIDSILILLNNERILKDKRSIIKSLIRLILTLLSKYEFLLKYVKQRQEIFYKLINIENDIYLILAFIMNNHQIKNILNHNENFALVLREYVNQLNKQQFYQNDFLTKRLKFLLEETIQNKGESKNATKENVQSNNRIPPNPVKSALEFDNNQQNLINSDVVSQEFNGIRVMESLTKHQDNLLSDGLQAPVRIQPEQNQNGHRQTDTNWIVSDTVTSLKNTQPEQMRNKHYQSDLNWIGSETGKNLINSQPEKVRNKHYHSDSNWISSETGKNLTNSKPEKIRSEHHQPDSNRILSETVQTLTNTQTEPTRSKHRQSDPNRIVTDTATILTNTQPESTRNKHRQSDSKRIVSDTGKNVTNSQPQQQSHNGHPQSDSSWNGTETKKSMTNSQPEPVRGGHHQSDSNRIVSETVKHLTNSQPEQIRNGHQQSEPNSVRLETLTNSTNSQSETIRSRHRQPDSSSIVSETIKNQEKNQPEHIRSGDQQTDFNSIVPEPMKNFEKNQPEQIHSEHYQPDSNWIGLETGKNLANSQLEQVNGGHHQSDVDWLLSETVKSLTNYQPEQNHNGHHQLDSNWILSAPVKTMTNNQPEQIHNKHHQSDSNSIVPQTVQVHNVSYQSDLDWIVSETMKNPMNSQLEEIPNGNNQMDWNWIVSETVKNLTNNHQSEEMHSGFNERDFNKIIKETMIQSGQQEPDEVFDSDSNHALTEITINPRKITSEQINNELEKSKSNEIFNKNGHELDIQEMSVEIPFDYIIFSNSNKNEEEIVLIWYDNNISKTVDMNKTIESLQQINDYVFICSNQQVFLKYIREIKKEKIFLILSESTIDEILNEIHNYEQIYSIFLCSVKPIKYEQYLNNEQLNKIIGIYTDFQSLLISIYENVQYEIKQIEIESLFYEKEQTIEDLNEFQSITIFKEILLNNSFDKNEELNQIICECQKYYKTNKKELINIDDFKRNYKSEDAIQWYIKQTFIYRLINKALKYENYQILLIFKIFIKDLCENIQKKFQLFKLKQNSNSVLSYSGLFLSNPRLENLKQNIGKILTTNTFFLAHKSKNLILKYFEKGKKHLHNEKVLLEIDSDISMLSNYFADINFYNNNNNNNSNENEDILFDFGTSFLINEINYSNNEQIWIIKLKTISNDCFIKDIQTYLTDNLSLTNFNILLGEIFFKMEKYSKSKNYFQTILNLYKTDDSINLSKIYDYLGQIYEYENNSSQAIENYLKSSNNYYLLNKLEDVARIYNYIGILYFNNNDKLNAKIFFNKAYDIWNLLNNSTSNNHNWDFARLISCCGCLEDNHRRARDFFLKALFIYENPIDISNIDNQDYYVSQVSEYLAERYYYDLDDDQAISYIRKSIQIREKSLSTIDDKVNYVKSLMKLWKFCEKSNENIWLLYQDEFIRLIDIEIFQLIPELKDLIDEIIFSKRNYLQYEFNENDSTDNLLELLETTLKTDENNHEKILQFHIDIGIEYTKINKIKWASQHLMKALQIYKTFLLNNNSKYLSLIYQSFNDIGLNKEHICNKTNLIKQINYIYDSTIDLTEKEKQAQNYFDLGEKFMSNDIDKSLEYFLKCLEIEKNYFQQNNLISAICHQNIASIFLNKFMYDIALEHYYKSLDIYEQNFHTQQDKNEYNIKLLYGKCHCNIARIYHKQNLYDKSTEYFLRTIKIMEENNIPSDNLCFLSECYEGIGLNFYRKSQYDLSIEYYEKCLNFLLTHIKSSKLCDHKKEIASCLTDLSCVYIDKKEYKRALENLEKISMILPDDDIDLGDSFLFIGLSYMEQKQYTYAINHFQNAIQHFQKHLPHNQLNYALCLSHLGTCYSNMHKEYYQNGIDSILKAISIYETNLPDNKSNIAQCYWTYAFILSKKGKYDEAIPNVYKSLEFRLNEDSINIGLSYNLLGLCYYKKFEFQEALSSFITSMQNYEKHLSDLYNEIGASIFLDIATCLLRLNNYEYSLAYATKSLDIRDEISTSIDLQKAECHSLLALIYSQEQIQQDDKCNTHCVKALQLLQYFIMNGDDIENIGDIFAIIAEIFLNINDLRQSQKYYEIALKYMKIDKIHSHPDIQRIQNIIDELTKTPKTP